MDAGAGEHLDEADAVLDYWLQEAGQQAWYTSDPGRDAEIRTRFLGLWQGAAAGRLGHWAGQPRPALALLILLDQFSRNIFRGTARAFAADPLALRAAMTALRLGHDLKIAEPERQFFYLPLMHSERLADQDRCVRLVLMRMEIHGADNLEHAQKHREVIRRFGRFPSRNAVLGRADSAAELAYREAGGYMS